MDRQPPAVHGPRTQDTGHRQTFIQSGAGSSAPAAATIPNSGTNAVPSVPLTCVQLEAELHLLLRLAVSAGRPVLNHACRGEGWGGAGAGSRSTGIRGGSVCRVTARHIPNRSTHPPTHLSIHSSSQTGSRPPLLSVLITVSAGSLYLSAVTGAECRLVSWSRGSLLPLRAGTAKWKRREVSSAGSSWVWANTRHAGSARPSTIQPWHKIATRSPQRQAGRPVGQHSAQNQRQHAGDRQAAAGSCRAPPA